MTDPKALRERCVKLASKLAMDAMLRQNNAPDTIEAFVTEEVTAALSGSPQVEAGRLASGRHKWVYHGGLGYTQCAHCGVMREAAIGEDCPQPLPADGWKDMASAPRDGDLIDLWCVPLDDDDFCPEQGGVRLTDCSWHDANDIFNFTGWVRILDDGNLDLVEGRARNKLGLPPWKPAAWRHLPTPPASTEGGADA